MAIPRQGAAGGAHPLGTLIYTVKEVAAALGLSTKTIYAAIAAGTLPAKKTGKHYLLTQADIQAYWASLPDAARTQKRGEK